MPTPDHEGMTRIGDDTDYLLFRKGSGNSVEIYDIAVNSERSKGKGTALVAELFAQIPAGVTMVWVMCRRSNHGARKFYLDKVGFQFMGALQGFYSDDMGQENALVFGKKP